MDVELKQISGGTMTDNEAVAWTRRDTLKREHEMFKCIYHTVGGVAAAYVMPTILRTVEEGLVDGVGKLYQSFSDNFEYIEENGHICCLS